MSVVLLIGIVLFLVPIAFALRQPFAMIGLVALLGLAPTALFRAISDAGKRYPPQVMGLAPGMNVTACNAGVVIGGADIVAWACRRSRHLERSPPRSRSSRYAGRSSCGRSRARDGALHPFLGKARIDMAPAPQTTTIASALLEAAAASPESSR